MLKEVFPLKTGVSKLNSKVCGIVMEEGWNREDETVNVKLYS